MVKLSVNSRRPISTDCDLLLTNSDASSRPKDNMEMNNRLLVGPTTYFSNKACRLMRMLAQNHEDHWPL